MARSCAVPIITSPIASPAASPDAKLAGSITWLACNSTVHVEDVFEIVVDVFVSSCHSSDSKTQTSSVLYNFVTYEDQSWRSVKTWQKECLKMVIPLLLPHSGSAKVHRISYSVIGRIHLPILSEESQKKRSSTNHSIIGFHHGRIYTMIVPLKCNEIQGTNN